MCWKRGIYSIFEELYWIINLIYSQVPRTTDALLMDESDSDETVLFGDKEARKPLTSTNDDEESD